MRHFLFGVIGIAIISGALCNAQTASDSNEGCRMTRDATTSAYTLSWWGKSSRTYFIQHSDDLVTWPYLPVIESGAAAVTQYGLTSTAPRFFLRLRHTDAPTGGNPDTADFDGDGLSNIAEVGGIGVTGARTDPLVADTDSDGFKDGFEVAQGSNPLASAQTPLTVAAAAVTGLDATVQAYTSVRASGATYTQIQDAYLDLMSDVAAVNALLEALGQTALPSGGGTALDDVRQNLEAALAPTTVQPQVFITGRFSIHLSPVVDPFSGGWRAISLNHKFTGPGYSRWYSDPVQPYSVVSSDLAFAGDMDAKMRWTFGMWNNYGSDEDLGLPRDDVAFNDYFFTDRDFSAGKVPEEAYATQNGLNAYWAEGREIWLQSAWPCAKPFSRTFLLVTEMSSTGDPIPPTVTTVTLTIPPGAEMVSEPVRFSPPQPQPGGWSKVTLLLPVELRDIKDHANTGDDATITNWTTGQEVTDANIAWIEAHKSATDDAPRMPQLVFNVPGLPQNVTLDAKLLVEYERPYAGKQTDDTVRIPTNGSFQSVTNGQWEIWNEYTNLPFFGGDATLTYKINGGAEQTIKFAIGGRNPDDARCKTYTQGRPNAPWYAYAIEKQESQAYNAGYYNQFWERSGNSSPINNGVNYNFTKGDSLIVRSPGETGVGGTGLAQVTGAGGNKTVSAPREIFWNWQKNVDAFLVIMAAKIQTAETFMNDPTPRNGPGSMPNGQRPQTTFHTGHRLYGCGPACASRLEARHDLLKKAWCAGRI